MTPNRRHRRNEHDDSGGDPYGADQYRYGGDERDTRAGEGNSVDWRIIADHEFIYPSGTPHPVLKIGVVGSVGEWILSDSYVHRRDMA